MNAIDKVEKPRESTLDLQRGLVQGIFRDLLFSDPVADRIARMQKFLSPHRSFLPQARYWCVLLRQGFLEAGLKFVGDLHDYSIRHNFEIAARMSTVLGRLFYVLIHDARF